MEFKKGTPTKKGLYVLMHGATIGLVRIVSDGSYNVAETLQPGGEWLRCPMFPASSKFSPRLRQARGYNADESVEQSLEARLRNANVEIAKLKAERSGWRVVKSPDQIRGGKPMFNLTHAMYNTDGVVKMIEDAGCTWAVDMHEEQRKFFIEHWGKLGSGQSAIWDVGSQSFSLPAVDMAWKLYKSMKGL